MTLNDLRPYQQEAVDAITAGLATGGRGQLHAACGSGKTQMAIHAAHRMLDGSALIVVLAPTLGLVAQTLRTWRAQQSFATAFAVCCADDPYEGTEGLVDMPVQSTTDPAWIAKWLSGTTQGRQLVVGTYASADRVAKALTDIGRSADLLVYDEAHHLVGDAQGVTRRVLDGTFLPAHRRLFLTATPRLDEHTSDHPDPGRYSMSDRDVFGPVLYDYPFSRAIAEGYLSDYQVVVIGVRQSDLRAKLADATVEWVDRHAGPTLRTLAAQAALVQMVRTHDLRRVIAFHPRVKDAAEFATTLTAADAAIPGKGMRCDPAHVHAGTPGPVRTKILDRLRAPKDGRCSVVSNVRILGEGIDVPAVDGVLFSAAKRSVVDIIQCVGRALRLNPDSSGKPAMIIVPAVVPDEEISEGSELDQPEYGVLWSVLRALRSHDFQLAADLDSSRASMGTGGEPHLPSKITLHVPPGTSESLLRELRVLLVERSTSSWWTSYGHAVEHHAVHGDLNVLSDFTTSSGVRLGWWLSQQRYHHRRGWLSPPRVEALERLGMVWDPLGDVWNRTFETLVAWAAEHGHPNAPMSTFFQGVQIGAWLNKQRRRAAMGRLPSDRKEALDNLGVDWRIDLSERSWAAGIEHAHAHVKDHGSLPRSKEHRCQDGWPLGPWLHTQRQNYRKGKLSPEQVAELEGLGMAWNLNEQKWMDRYAVARQYHQRHGNLDVPHAHVEDGVKLGSWVLHQRQKRSGVKNGILTERQVALLDGLGMRW